MFRMLMLVLALLFGAVAGTAHAETRWQNFGADPAYSSRVAAIANAPQDMRRMELSEKVIQAFKVAMRTPGTRVRLTNGDRLAFMRTGPNGLWRDVLVDFRRPVRNMEYAAPAEEWTVTVDGVTYTYGIPDICNNSYLKVQESDCVELTFNAPVGGHVDWGVGSRGGPLPPDRCNAQRQGNGEFDAWYGECSVCVPNYGYISQMMGGQATVPHKYRYRVTQQQQTIRFSRAIWSRTVYICLEDANGRRTCGVYVPPNGVQYGWDSRRHVHIQDSFWVWGHENCPH